MALHIDTLVEAEIVQVGEGIAKNMWEPIGRSEEPVTLAPSAEKLRALRRNLTRAAVDRQKELKREQGMTPEEENAYWQRVFATEDRIVAETIRAFRTLSLEQVALEKATTGRVVMIAELGAIREVRRAN